ncbi:MAG: OmpA family protein [Bacteroidota bacterium]|nr:OmpA family protein [Bacteroidota bacterium]
MNRVKIVFVILLVFQFMTGCKNMTHMQKGALIGAGTGTVVGGVVGKLAKNTAAGAIIGAAVGGTAGALIGRYMDKQAMDLNKELKNAKVERIGEGIKITFDSGILFKISSSDLSPQAISNIDQLAGVLNKYKDTNILIEGHTDNTGSHDFNMALSERRAGSVASYLQSKSVASDRIITKGYGPDQPVADNSTEATRSLNRRVEVAIYANNKLKAAAQNGQVPGVNQ